MTTRPLRPHQIAGLDRLRDALRSGASAVMFQAPTGFGKTRVMAEIVVRALDRGKRVLIIVPALLLVDQTVAELKAEGVDDIGVIQGAHERTDSAARVQVASVQTLQKRPMPACDLILVDEAHAWFKLFAGMIAAAKAVKKPVIGLSATPWTRGLGRHYDALVNVISTAELIRQGFLSPFRVFAPSHPDLSKVRTIAGDFHEGELAHAMNQPALVADVVKTWLQRGERRPTLCFAVDRAHARELQTRFTEAGVPTAYVDALTTRDEREEIRRQFHSGAIEIVCSVGTMTKGVDWDVRAIIMARPTKSEMLFVQIIGRGLRTAPGKTDCLIFDHSSTHATLGLVTDIQHDALDDGEGRRASRSSMAKPRECPECRAVYPAKFRACPACGFAPVRQVDVGAGDLVHFREASAQRAAEERARRASVYGQLKAIANDRGYASGWAFHKFVERFGAKPSDVEDARPIPPTPEILGWVKSRQIAFARRRQSA